jgi:pinin/SDK/memA/ protein conserved region
MLTFRCRTLASAVVVPEADQPSPPDQTTSLKRRQSDLIDFPADSKRARFSSEDHGLEPLHSSNHQQLGPLPTEPTNVEEVPTGQRTTRRQTGRDEERKRGQRMFGVLLGALSSTDKASKAAKRRADIEKRQAEKLRQLDEDASQREKDNAEEIRRKRRKEQWMVDAVAVCIAPEFVSVLC